MATSLAPFIKGKNVRRMAIVYQDEKLDLPVKSWSLQRNATEITDDVNGEDRSRLDEETNFFSIQVTCYKDGPALLRKFFAAQDVQDARTTPADSSVGVKFSFYNGDTLKLITSGQHSIGNWSINSGGRVERIMQTFTIRCQYVNEA